MKNIIKVGVGEYFTSYLTDENKIYAVLWNGSANVFTDFGLTGVIDVHGAQYTNIVLLNDGTIRVINKGGGGGANITTYATQSGGGAFNNNAKVYGWFQTFLTIKNDGTLWYFGNDAETYGSLNLTGSVINQPVQLTQPTGGRVISKVVIGDQDTRSFIVLCTDGTVWTYTRGGGGVPVQKSGLSGITDIGGISRACYVALTATDIKAWGQFTSFVQLSDNVTTPTSILSQFTAQGLVMPIKEIANNYNILAMIDANDHLWMLGDNPMGEAGIGDEINPYNTGSFPFSWSFTRGQKMITTPVQVRGKWKNLCNSGSIAFYFHAQGMHNEWYSWGRNKQYALGTGFRINNDNTYPCYKDVPAPRSVEVSTQTWGSEPNINPADPLPPMANAGQDQDITASSATLYGDYSFQQEHSITGYAWSQISGPNTASITSPTSANTGVTGLVNGTYVFRITVTNSNALTHTDDVTLYVAIPAAEPTYKHSQRTITPRRGRRVKF